MGSMSIWHWVIVLVVVVLIFGTKRLKNVGKDVGEAVKGFKQGMSEDRPPGQLGDESRRDEAAASEQRRDDNVPR